MGSVRHRVVVGILIRPGQVLMCHRRADRDWYPDVWDFPGGHLEPGETAEEALVREAREELGVHLVGPLTEQAAWSSDDGEEDITFLLVERWHGQPANLAPEEHDAIRWVSVEEALALRLPDPAYPHLLRSLPVGTYPAPG